MEEESPVDLMTGDLVLVSSKGYEELIEDGVEDGHMNT